MRRFFLILLVSVYLIFSGFGQESYRVSKEFSLNVTPAEAMIFQYTGNKTFGNQLIADALAFKSDLETTGKYKLLGKGRVSISMKDYGYSDLTILIFQEGYKPEVREYTYDKDIQKNLDKGDIQTLGISLNTRLFYVDALPFGSTISIDNEIQSRPYPCKVEIPVNSGKTIEVKKEGYLTISGVFYNQDQKPSPPTGIYTVTLTDRVIQLNTSPAIGAYISVDGMEAGEGSTQVVVPEGKCVLVKIKKEGYTEKERQYCNKNGSPVPLLRETITLEDRELIIRVPNGASILINGKEVGTKEYILKLMKDTKAEVTITKPGFVDYKTTVYNKSNEAPPPHVLNIQENSPELPEDESFTASSESDLANKDFTLDIPETLKEEDAWKVIALIIQSYFDELEQIDRETGYIRTAWVYKKFPNRTIRTRVILKLKSRNPLKYALKISSEENHDSLKLNSKDDDDYKEWNRVLNRYKEMIIEAQSRIR